ncbi:MAG TPA: aldose 1-epimerase [Deltaproteobacteria bacterium]|jgi:aldose 1-epimerase|nr:aldose 1-epimerase [Deltaproteobacteria bacterium]
MPLEVENGGLRLRVAPEVGASVVDLSFERGGSLVPLLRRAHEPLSRSSDAACFLLVPYSNRLRDGRFRFEGRSYELGHPKPDAIHGDVRDRRWQVGHCCDHGCTLTFDSRAFGDVHFPFPFAAEVSYRLQDGVFTNALRVVNVGEARMPAGLGFHPYFNRALGPASEEVLLELAVRGVYPDSPERPALPIGPPVGLRPGQDFSKLRPLDVALDHCFAGWDGHAEIRWPESRVRVVMEASARLRHVIVYSPPAQPFFAVEPVSHANDGFNLFASGQPGTGVVVLAAGESLEGSFSLSVENSA